MNPFWLVNQDVMLKAQEPRVAPSTSIALPPWKWKGPMISVLFMFVNQ